MVLFDKGGNVLKSVEFHKEKKEWLYQLKHASEFSDRADALVALGKIKNDEEVIGAVGNAAASDKAPGIRAKSAEALGKIGGHSALKQLLAALDNNDLPEVRYAIVTALGSFKDDAAIVAKLEAVAKEDRSFRARASALQALGHLKAPNAYTILTAAVSGDSPDGFLRDAALRGFGFLGDDKAVPLLREWSAPGKPIASRNAAIASLGRLDKGNKDVTQQITSYLSEPHFAVRSAAIYALGSRGDTSAIPALEALLHVDNLSIEMVPMIKDQIAKLEKHETGKASPHSDNDDGEDDEAQPVTSSDQTSVTQRLDKLEHLVQEVNDRLKSIEARLTPPAQK
jgi:HEAT repeat protein